MVPWSINPVGFGDPLTFPLVPPAGQTFHLSCKISTGFIGTKFGTDIRFPQRISPTDLGNPLTFPLQHAVNICGF